MPSSAVSTSSFRGILRRFRGNRRGSAAVEFALVAPVFFALLFAILESALMFFASQVLETVTQDSARMILTGQAQNGQLPACPPTAPCTTPEAQFKTYVCSKIPGLFDCEKLKVDVESFSSFSSVTLGSDALCNFDVNMQYNPGSAGSIVVVRLFYQWPLIVTGLGYNISNVAGNKRCLVATAAFMNEPY